MSWVHARSLSVKKVEDHQVIISMSMLDVTLDFVMVCDPLLLRKKESLVAPQLPHIPGARGATAVLI